MEQYIPKAAVVAGIRKRLLPTIRDKHYDEWEEGQDSERIAILEIIDTLEVKEVDLDREIRRYRMRNPIIQHREESLYDYMANVAKHFFELGMAVSNKQIKEKDV